MKHLYLIIFSFLFTFSLYGQQLTIKYGEISQTVDHGVFTYALKDSITNNTDAPREFRWVRNINDLPDGWVTGICDVNTCHAVTTSQMNFTLQAYETAEIGPQFFPTDPFSTDPLPSGTGTVEIFVFALDDEDVNVTTTITFEISPGVSTNNFQSLNLQAFPNPATDYISVRGLTQPVDAEIFSTTGQRVMETFRIQGSNQMIAIQQLPQGVYFLRMFNDEGHSKTLRFLKP